MTLWQRYAGDKSYLLLLPEIQFYGSSNSPVTAVGTIFEFQLHKTHPTDFEINIKTMNTPKTLLYLSLAVSLWACNAARIPACSENDRKAIMEVLADYRLSINQADTTLGKKVFLTNENISFIHPRGHQHGWKEVKTNIYGMFDSKFSQRDLKSSNETVTLYGDMAVLEFTGFLTPYLPVTIPVKYRPKDGKPRF